MVTKNIPTNEDLKELIEIIDKHANKIRDRQKDSVTPIEEPAQEKKELTKPKKEYKSFMKVASILAIFALSVFWVYSLYVPNIYDAIATLFRDLFPSVTGSSGIDYYVD